METEDTLRHHVEKYVEKIVKMSLEIVIKETHDNQQVNRKEVSKDCAKTNNGDASHADVIQFAECLVDGSLEEGMKELEKLSKIKPVLSVGISALDFVTACEKFPEEDSKVMAVDTYWSRGGNAANTATVLAHLGARVEYFGTIVNNRWLSFMQDDFKRTGVITEHCVYLDEEKHKPPIATLIINEKTGTRTVLADFKDITGVTYKQFSSLDIGKYSWIHLESRSFEGRPDEMEAIIALVIKHNKRNIQSENRDTDSERVFISIEVEQPYSSNPEFRPLFSKGDVILIGKDYAMDGGYSNKEEAVRELYKYCQPGAILVCTWGDDGAAAMFMEELVCSPAFTPEKIVDTLGAGDTFNAAFIYAFSRGKSLDVALKFGCLVAGHKCGRKGFSCVQGMERSLYHL